MKPCPQCGYEGTKSHRALLALYRKHFPGIPVWDMIKRGWINAIDEPTDSQTDELVAMIRRELVRFFSLESESELDGFIAGTFDPLSRLFYMAVRPRLANPRALMFRDAFQSRSTVERHFGQVIVLRHPSESSGFQLNANSLRMQSDA